ncbi:MULTISPECIES: SGNH/GDSL hydrolase family protein [Leptolyngbya]|uniref:SGNH/GDSL hydrolase family protein n=1 Tax=Leptolyngbya TaxID=47251 RepID=UPI001683E7E0|nr:SGNH/GDSL hydrolase family protein [Leptolyngbya sp. FACHB-1624]MBD1857901.1 SGNH/GDSL hydrolase family protein [Leptolyngbya sp. FACHB-1624]
MRFTVLMGAIAVLGASIALNVILFSQAKKYYLELNETRLDPVGLSTYSTSPSPSQNRPRVVFFGDSRAENWTFPEMSQYEFIDRGISSQTSVQAIQRFQQHVRPLQPRVIIVQVGINDLKTIALFPERKAEIIANCRSNIERIVQESKALGAIVILTTIFPVGDVPLQRQPFWSDEIGQAVQEMNRELAALASDRVMIFDAFSILADSQGKLRSDYRMDELHLNQQGYSRLNQALIEPLEMLKL